MCYRLRVKSQLLYCYIVKLLLGISLFNLFESEPRIPYPEPRNL